MKKVYESHELAYKRLKKKGASSWNEMYSTEPGKDPEHIDLNRKRLITSAFEKDWFPKNGNALEIGCGTGPLIRWISEKGFNGTGIDISNTAIKLAKEQTKNNNTKFINGDFCYTKEFKNNKFDLILDGHCFHCVVEENDRKIFLERSYNLLKKDGIFVLSTMCSPINRKQFNKNFKTGKFINNTLYIPFDDELEGSKIFNGKMYMAQRKIEHWKKIIKSVKDLGYEIKMFQFDKGEVFSEINIIAKKV